VSRRKFKKQPFGCQRICRSNAPDYAEYERIKDCLDIWLPVLKEYYKYKEIKQEPIGILKREKQKGTLLFPFYSEESKKFEMYDEQNNYRSMFNRFFKKSDIPKYFCTHTHFLRESRITEWVKQGWEFFDVHKNARHKTFEQTQAYFKGSDEDRADRIAKNRGLSDVPELGFQFPEPKVFDIMVYEVIKVLNKEGYTNNLPLLNRFFISQLRNKVISNINSSSNIGEYYTVEEIAKKWGLSKSQTHARLKLLEKKGLIQLKTL